ncbi:hypothetical protein [Kocuria nitroreducens]|uniref:hypothetical protein n=1 Tax=Kocuria nitroreducens TaxID=3058914 RepID=UPI0036DAA39B
MAAAAGEAWWRRMLAIGFLSFAALGLAGCDDSGSGGEENTEQEAPAGGEETAGDEATDAIEDDASTQGEGPTEGEHPAEEDHQEDDG